MKKFWIAALAAVALVSCDEKDDIGRELDEKEIAVAPDEPQTDDTVELWLSTTDMGECYSPDSVLIETNVEWLMVVSVQLGDKTYEINSVVDSVHSVSCMWVNLTMVDRKLIVNHNYQMWGENLEALDALFMEADAKGQNSFEFSITVSYPGNTDVTIRGDKTFYWIGKWEDKIGLQTPEMYFSADGGTQTAYTSMSGWWLTDIEVDGVYRYIEYNMESPSATIEDMKAARDVEHRWLKCHKNEGNTEIRVTVEPNPSTEPRHFTINLCAFDFFAAIHGTQEGRK